MKRGDLVTVAPPDEFGKPRPALIIQSDRFHSVGTATVLLLSTALVHSPLIRLDVAPTAQNGLRKPSQIMIDKIISVKRSRIGTPFGRLDDATMVAVKSSLALFLGFG